MATLQLYAAFLVALDGALLCEHFATKIESSVDSPTRVTISQRTPRDGLETDPLPMLEEGSLHTVSIYCGPNAVLRMMGKVVHVEMGTDREGLGYVAFQVEQEEDDVLPIPFPGQAVIPELPELPALPGSTGTNYKVDPCIFGITGEDAEKTWEAAGDASIEVEVK